MIADHACFGGVQEIFDISADLQGHSHRDKLSFHRINTCVVRR